MVNVSPRQFTYPDLVSDVEGALRETGMDPRRLHLEVTESAAMADPERTKRVLTQTEGPWESPSASTILALDILPSAACGASRWTWSRSTARLSPTWTATRRRARSCISIIEFAHAVSLKVIAEGVESAAHRDQLKSLGCDYGQGYFFSRPVDQEGVERLLARSAVPQEPRPQAARLGRTRGIEVGGLHFASRLYFFSTS